MFRKNQHIAYVFVHTVGTATRFSRKKARQAPAGNIGGNAGRKDTGSGKCDGTAVKIGGKNLHFVALPQCFEALLQQDGNRISLFTRRAAGRPDANGAARWLAFEQLGDDLCLQHVKGFRVAEKIGHTDQQVPKQGFDLHWCLLQVPDVAVHRIDLVHRHAPLDTTIDGAGFIL